MSYWRFLESVYLKFMTRSPDMAAMHQDTSENYEVVEEKLNKIFEVYAKNDLLIHMIISDKHKQD